MNNKDLKVVLEVEKESANHENEMFYRYRVGDFKLWFTQDQGDGNIYSVGFAEDGDKFKDFEMYIFAHEEGRDGYFPNEFEIRPRSYGMATGDARAFMEKMEQACKVLDTVEEFFKNSKHYELYADKHGIEFEKVEVQDELIRRSDLMDAVLAHFDGRWEAVDDDCRKVWNVIVNYDLHSGDLVNREGLLNAVLDEFGCDLAYYGRDLQFFQDAIIGIPAASANRLDDLICNAESQKFGVSEKNSSLQSERRAERESIAIQCGRAEHFSAGEHSYAVRASSPTVHEKAERSSAGER